jgi:hypothetical protein
VDRATSAGLVHGGAELGAEDDRQRQDRQEESF